MWSYPIFSSLTNLSNLVGSPRSNNVNNIEDQEQGSSFSRKIRKSSSKRKKLRALKIWVASDPTMGAKYGLENKIDWKLKIRSMKLGEANSTEKIKPRLWPTRSSCRNQSMMEDGVVNVPCLEPMLCLNLPALYKKFNGAKPSKRNVITSSRVQAFKHVPVWSKHLTMQSVHNVMHSKHVQACRYAVHINTFLSTRDISMMP